MNPQPSKSILENVSWESIVSPEHWAVYKSVLDRICDAGIPFALGGGLAVGVYTSRLRPSKDLDVYILPEHRTVLADLMSECGLEDYYDQLPYDRRWIYRGHYQGVIVDAIWAMANQRAQVDRDWLVRGPIVNMSGQQFRIIPPEELIWSKLYVLQHDRCDWPDVLNLIYSAGPGLDWDHLLARVAQDGPLVKGVLSIFAWMCPARASLIPRRVWKSFGLAAPKPQEEGESANARMALLDSRPWLVTESQAA